SRRGRPAPAATRAPAPTGRSGGSRCRSSRPARKCAGASTGRPARRDIGRAGVGGPGGSWGYRWCCSVPAPGGDEPREGPLMIRKFISALILVPLAIVLVVFAVANRQTVLISFDPFDQAHPALSLSVPLFALI